MEEEEEEYEEQEDEKDEEEETEESFRTEKKVKGELYIEVGWNGKRRRGKDKEKEKGWWRKERTKVWWWRKKEVSVKEVKAEKRKERKTNYKNRIIKTIR